MTGPLEIVIVDDDADSLEALADLVRFLGFEPSPFDRAVPAHAYVTQALPRVAAVLTDLEMPELDGAALARELRRTAGALPILLVSGAAEPQLDTLRHSGLFVDVIGKGAGFDTLTAAIARAIGSPRAG